MHRSTGQPIERPAHPPPELAADDLLDVGHAVDSNDSHRCRGSAQRSEQVAQATQQPAPPGLLAGSLLSVTNSLPGWIQHTPNGADRAERPMSSDSNVICAPGTLVQSSGRPPKSERFARKLSYEFCDGCWPCNFELLADSRRGGATASSVYEWAGNEGGQSERTHDVHKRTAAAVREVGQIV